jgi:thiamine kinase-like enzyme
VEHFYPVGTYSSNEMIQNFNEVHQKIKDVHNIPLSKLSNKVNDINTFINHIKTWYKTLNNELLPEHAQNFFNLFDISFTNSFENQLKMCLCHNDLHSGNFLKNGMIIDFEYACINYEIYDWANLANELELHKKNNEYAYIENKSINSMLLILLPDHYKSYWNFFQKYITLIFGVMVS